MKFTDEQQWVIDSNDPVCVVQAGPGTGKTTTVAGHIAHRLSKEKRSGFDFLAITFSRFAASQLKDKVQQLDPGERWKIDVNTFHGFALDVISRFLVRNLTIVEEKDMVRLMDKNGYWSLPVTFKEYIQGKNLSPTMRRKGKEQYSKILTQVGWITYEEILLTLLDMPEALDWIHDRYAYLYVDEAQDMTPTQLALAEKMNIQHTMYIGDVSQAIYEWNGASPVILMELSQKYPTYTLTHNWRSRPEIVQASNRLISHNKMIITNKNVAVSDRAGGVTVHWVDYEDYHQKINSIVSKHLDVDGVEPSDVAILCRTNHEVASIIANGGDIPFEQSLATSRLRDNPMLQLMIQGARVRNDRTKANYIMLNEKVSLVDGVIPDGNKFMVMESNQALLNKVPDWLGNAINEPSFMEYVHAFTEHLGPEFLNPDRGLIDHIVEVFALQSADDLSDKAFMRWFATFSLQDVLSAQSDHVKVMTIHQSKGLEFKHVIAPIPKYKADDEESRRIVFVAWTRSVETLDILTTRENKYLEEAGL